METKCKDCKHCIIAKLQRESIDEGYNQYYCTIMKRVTYDIDEMIIECSKYEE